MSDDVARPASDLPDTRAAAAPDLPTAAPAEAAGLNADPAWVQRFTAARVSVPDFAEDAPDRCLYLSNATGTYEVYAWDRSLDDGADPSAPAHRQVTDRPNGTVEAALPRDGSAVWWFADTDGDEYGTWQRQPFAGGPDTAALPFLPAAYSVGLAFGPAGEVVVGSADDAYGTRIHWTTPDADPTTAPGADPVTGRPDVEPTTVPGVVPVLVYEHEQSASIGALSRDGTLLAVDHSEHGDARHPAVRVLDLRAVPAGGAPGVVGELWDGPGRSTSAVEFAPVDGDRRLLVTHERGGRPALLIWDLATGEQTEIDPGLPGEVSGGWLPDARGLVLRHDHEARSTLFRYDLVGGELVALPTPRGTVSGITVRSDGEVWFDWSSSAEGRVVRALPTSGATGTPGGLVDAVQAGVAGVVLRPPGHRPPESVPATDVWADGPGGRVHALLQVPSDAIGGPAPQRPPRGWPLYVEVHGGPTWHESDAFAPATAAWVDAGYATVRVNYRGSTGYGAAWRDALEAKVGFTELADVLAVRDKLVADGVADPGRCVLAGGSWGGYLTLLGVGTQPDSWAVGLAAVPVADYVAAYEDEMEPLKAFDRSLFGGTPAEKPDAYRVSSPLTYVDAVRAPVLVLAGENDPRCPIRQIDTYLAALTNRGIPHEVYRFDAGHGSLVVAEQVRQARAELDFARRALAGEPVGDKASAGQASAGQASVGQASVGQAS